MRRSHRYDLEVGFRGAVSNLDRFLDLERDITAVVLNQENLKLNQ